MATSSKSGTRRSRLTVVPKEAAKAGAEPAAETAAVQGTGKTKRAVNLSASAKATRGESASVPTPAAPTSEPAIPEAPDASVPEKVKDAWSALAAVDNNSRSVGELLGKAGLKGWDVRPEPTFAFVPTGKCSICGKTVGQPHDSGCGILDLASGDDVDANVDENDTTEEVEVPGCFALIRTDPATGKNEAIGSGARQFKPVPIEKRAEILTQIAKEIDVKFGPAGPLWDNTAAFASLKVADRIPVGAADELELRIVLLNSFVPGRPSQLILSAVRTRSSTVQHFPYDAGSLDGWDDPNTRLGEAASAVSSVRSTMDFIGRTASEMLSLKMERAEFAVICNRLWNPPASTASKRLKDFSRLRTALLEKIFLGKYDLFEGIGGTRWAAWQAIQTVNEHMVHLPITDDDHDGELRRRAQQGLFGRMAALSARAYELLKD